MKYEYTKYKYAALILILIVTFSSTVYSADQIPKEIQDPAEQECLDIDQDNYTGSYCGGLDCNDNNISINPSSLEICGNDIDENCDGIIEQCIVDDLEMIQVIYEGELIANNEIKFNVEYTSTVKDPELLIQINNESYALGENNTSFSYLFIKGGDYLVTFVLDPENKVQETNEANNKIELNINIKGIYLCDFQNEITGCIVCSCNNGEICSASGECTELENSPILTGIRSISFYPSEYQNYIFANGLKILEKNEYKTTYFHNDFVGSLAFTTDENGIKGNEILYLPFGEYNKNIYGQGFFTGKEQDDSGLYYYGARYYNPQIGRFTQVDPVLDEKTSSYNYVNNNPFKYNDPDGREKKDARAVQTSPPELIFYGSDRNLFPARTTKDPSRSSVEMARELMKTLSILHYIVSEDRQERIASVARDSSEAWGSLERNFNLQTPEGLSNEGTNGEITVLEKARQVFEQVQPPSQLSGGMSDHEIMLNNFLIITGDDGNYIAEKYGDGKISDFYKMTEEVEKSYAKMQLRLNPQLYDTSIVEPGNENHAPDATSVRIVVGEDSVKWELNIEH